jgi:hypothetical protein
LGVARRIIGMVERREPDRRKPAPDSSAAITHGEYKQLTELVHDLTELVVHLNQQVESLSLRVDGLTNMFDPRRI